MSNCKGLIFKRRKSSYYSKDRMVFKQEYYLMKSLSCNNCPKCEYIKEQIKIDISQDDEPWGLHDILGSNDMFEAYLIDEYQADIRPVKIDKRF